jgi:hypothetical protein
LVIVIAAFVICTTQKDKIQNMAMQAMDKGFVTMEQLIVANVPQSVSADSARAVCQKAFTAIKNGTANQQATQDFMQSFQVGMKDQQLDSLEVVTILEKMEAVPE